MPAVAQAAEVRVPTVPMVATAPLAQVARPRKLTYDVYTPDDTLRGARAVTDAEATSATREQRKRKRIGLGVIGLAVTLGTSLMAIGSCDDSATSRVETTAAVVSAAPTSAAPTSAAPTTSAAAPEVIPPIVFSPPLSPPAPRRRPIKAAGKR